MRNIFREMEGQRFFEGYAFNQNKITNLTTYYRCATYRRTGCPAKLICKDESIQLKGTHSCESKSILFNANKNENKESISSIDSIEDKVKEYATNLCLFPFEIYQKILNWLRETHSNQIYQIPSKKYVYSKISNIRGSNSLKDISAVTLPPLKYLSSGKIMCRRHWKGDFDGQENQALIWATDESLALLRYNGPTFIDCTFRVVPSPFLQCLIVMVFDYGSNLFVPCVYSLLTSKNEYMYCTVLHEIIVLLKYSWMPCSIVVDFEFSLIKACKHEFPESVLIGCYFHMKQALFKKISKLYPNNSDIYKILKNIELLTIINQEDIMTGIEFIKHTIQKETNEFNEFWNYFTKTWIERFDPEIWNLNNKDENILVGRTNNSLERYNRRLGEFFMNAHPNIAAFANIVRNEFEYYSDVCRQVRETGNNILFGEHEFIKPEIDPEYINWVNERKNTNK